MVTIIYCHPYDKSFNHQILNSIVDELDNLGREYSVINLYDEHFDPILGVNDLALYSQGKTTDEQVIHYQEILHKTDHLIMVFPIWWDVMPAMLKGFFDKTFLKGSIYDTTPDGLLMPCLSIDRSMVITTSQQPTEVISPFIEDYLIPRVLNTVGINNVDWHNCPRISYGTAKQRRAFIDEVLAEISKRI